MYIIKKTIIFEPNPVHKSYSLFFSESKITAATFGLNFFAVIYFFLLVQNDVHEFSSPHQALGYPGSPAIPSI